MNESLNDYYESYRLSVRRDLPLEEFTDYTVNYKIGNLPYLSHITDLKNKTNAAIKSNDVNFFYQCLIDHKFLVLAILEEMVLKKILKTDSAKDVGSKFQKGVIGKLSKNQIIVPNCSFFVPDDGILYVFVDELRLIMVNEDYAQDVVRLKESHPNQKIILNKGSFEAVEINNLNKNIVRDWTAPLPFENLGNL
jgi:hypothetical protein